MRLFFGLWPENEHREQLYTLAESLTLENARLLAKSNTHMTLAFLGNVDEEIYARLEEGAKQIQARSFSLRLDSLGWWQKPKIAWVGPSTYPDELPTLAQALHALARDCGLQLPERPYRPHLTLARKVKSDYEAVDFEPILWNIREFCLIESISQEQGVRYEVKLRWPLKIM
ncbi:MAG: RNA 2',3'-cyclic phosphodiesterase [Gammaproteobacteria bacterium]|nr:RNA 2',3'-cyclic phosphodiesterase [Gammaproteobacteria bacterium]